MKLAATTLALLLVLALAPAAYAEMKNLWLCAEEIAALPNFGAAYSRVLTAANSPWPLSDVSVQNTNCASFMLAGALIWQYTGTASYRSRVRDSLMSARRRCPIKAGILQNNYQYSPHRFIPGLVAAADLIDLEAFAPDSNTIFRGWLDSLKWVPLKTTNTSQGFNVKQYFESQATGMGGGAAYVAAAAYLGQADTLTRAYAFYKSYANQSFYPGTTVRFPSSDQVGDYFNKGAIGGWIYEPTWVCTDTSSWTVVSPNCNKTDPADGDIASIDGANVPQLSRQVSGGPAEPFTWPPYAGGKMYQWDNNNHLFIMAEIFYRLGYPDAYSQGLEAPRRLMEIMVRAGSPGGPLPQYPQFNWVAWLSNYRYSAYHPTANCTSSGNWSIYWTDWTHAAQPGVPPPVAPTILSVVSAGDGLSATVNLDAPGAGDTEYDLRISDREIFEVEFDQHTRITAGVPVPVPCDNSESFSITGLCPGRAYYLAAKAKNPLGWSAMSNVYALTTSSSGACANAPGTVSMTINAGSPGSYDVSLLYTIPGDNGFTGIAGWFDVRYSTTGAIDTEEKWGAAFSQFEEWAPAGGHIGGDPAQHDMTLPAVPGTYYFSVRYRDSTGNIGALSNSPSQVLPVP